MEKYMNDHPWLTFFIVIGIITAIGFTIRYVSHQKSIQNMTPEQLAEYYKSQNITLDGYSY